MTRPVALIALLATALGVYAQSTPVIGGGCKIGMADVQIGGKQTQFFLKCEAASDSPDGEGVWVVKSRAASPPATETVQHRPAKKPANPNICEQDNGARESDSCAVSAMCLQADQNNPVNYLQCDQTSMRWQKKSCQDTFVFNFEQQTCIVPRKSLTQPSHNNPSTNSSIPFDCSQCPLGTVCEQGECTPAHSSTLCADGSAPLGSCPCPSGAECTAKGVCCASGRVCVHCSNAKPCPEPQTCSPSGCCEPRKHRHPSNQHLPFVSPADLFDSVIVQGPAPGFRVMSIGPPAKKMVLNVEEATVFTPNESFSTTETSKPETLGRSAKPSYDSGALVSGASLGDTCIGHADCLTSTDCPSSFICEVNCCRLSICPGGAPVQFACSTNYQCGAGEKCLFGGCCGPRKEESNDENPYDSAPEAPEPPMHTTSTPPTTHKHRPTSMMPAFGPQDVCEVDTRVSNCSLSSPCPETSECMFGVCCHMPTTRCASGLLALSLPETCRMDDDCPIASRCEYGRCCPQENAEITRNDEPPPVIVKTTTASVIKKPRCLVSPRCSSMTLCPPRFTCSLDGRCCRLDVVCPDGTVPEDSCDESHLCPSSAQSCVKMGQHKVCCAMAEELEPMKVKREDSGCPEGSEEVPPRFGTSCRYSLQCPRPYFCNSRGKCCQQPAIVVAQPSSGLSCTYSACSNSNPCNTGTCNNGYCCSSGSNSAPQIIGTCAGGFDSPLKCTVGDECPPGLACDKLVGACCPLLLPLTDANNPTKPPKSRRPTRGYGEERGQEEQPLRFGSRPCCNNIASPSSGCNGCAQQQQPIVISTCPGGGYPVGQCSSGYCSPGYSCVSNSCCPSYSAPAPSVQIYSCPSGGSAVGACISGACATGYTCVSGGCCPSATTQNPFVCPDGTQAVGGCVNGKCGTGYTCSNGLCCAGTSTSVRCLDGSEAVGACIPSCQGNACGGSKLTYYCGSGYTCTTGNICCAVQSCPNGGTALGPSVNGLCPVGYTAQNGVCCSNACPNGEASTPTVNGQCPDGLTLTNGVCCAGAAAVTGQCFGELDASTGPCTDGACPGQIGYACDTTSVAGQQLCCPAFDWRNQDLQVGPAVQGMCPLGHVLVYYPGLPDPDQNDPGRFCYPVSAIEGVCAEVDQDGPCANGQCPTGSTCNTVADVCCKNTAVFRRLRNNQRVRPQIPRPTYGRPLASYMPPRDMTCPDGSAASGGCMNGLCGLGLECRNGLCCAPQKRNSLSSQCPNGQSAVSGCFGDGSCGTGFECVKRVNLCCPPGGNEPIVPVAVKSTIRPIGGRCFMDEECVGASEGLSLCHAGVCQCSPIAYSQGIACVRRKALMMNDSPLEVEKNEVTKTA